MTAPGAPEAVGVDSPVGETLSIPERVIVAPAMGIFHRLPGDTRVNDGDLVARGDVVGTIRSLGASTPVQSPFEGLLVAILAFDGERVRSGQPVAWLRVTGRGSIAAL